MISWCLQDRGTVWPIGLRASIHLFTHILFAFLSFYHRYIGKSKLVANGFENVTLLTKKADRNAALSIQRINNELCRLTNEEGRALSNALKIVSAKNAGFLEKTARKLGPLEGCREMLQRFAKWPGSAMYFQVQKSLHFRRKEKPTDSGDGDDLVHPITRRDLKRKRQDGQEMEE